MMKLFIVFTGNENSDSQKTLKSFELIRKGKKHLLFSDFDVVPNITSIKGKRPESGWYMIMFDNECISLGLREVLSIYLMNDSVDLDAWVIMKKKEGSFFQAPRLFKHNIELDSESLGVRGLKTNRILDGWIVEH